MKFDQFLISVQNRFFQPLEFICRKMNNTEDIIPVWIVGAPRSGTTLAYQVLCRCFKATYLTNRVAKRYRVAHLSRWYERNILNSSMVPESFRSAYGKTNLPDDPNEGGQFFYQFFPTQNPYTEKDFLSVKKKNEFRNLISSITAPNNLFISKNTYHSL